MSKGLNLQLTEAARDGNIAEVETLMAAGADWRAEREEALFQALQNDHRSIAKIFLSTLFPPKTDYAWSGNPYIPTPEEELDSHFSSMHPPHLLAYALRQKSDGLFRHVLEKYPETVKEYGMEYSKADAVTRYIPEILDAGGDVRQAAGEWFYNIVAGGDLQTAEALVRHGVDTNKVWSVLGHDLHCLQAAASIRNEELRNKFFDLLIEAGADFRINNCGAIRLMVFNQNRVVFDLYERLDPGSEMMAILANGMFQPTSIGIRKEAAERFHFLEKWASRDLPFTRIFSGANAAPAEWVDSLSAGDLAADDGFILKLAAAAPAGRTLAPLLISRGADPDTQKDPPLKVAALLGKDDVVEALLDAGADVYAGKASLLRREKNICSEDVAAALQSGPGKAETAARDILAAAFPESYDLADLRRTLTEKGDTGLMLDAKAGTFRDSIAEDALGGMTAEDFLKENKNGTSVAAILAARGEFDLLFSPKIWKNDMPGLEKVWNALLPCEQKQAQARYTYLLQNRGAATERQLLRQQARLPRLKPRGFPPR